MREKSPNFIGGQEHKGKPERRSGVLFGLAKLLSLGGCPIDHILKRR
jgi:hypothetical protein